MNGQITALLAACLVCALSCSPTLEGTDFDVDGGVPDADGTPSGGSGGEPPLCTDGDLECSGSHEDGGDRPPRPRDCAPGTEWIYATGYTPSPDFEDHEDEIVYQLLRYEPDSGGISIIGELNCPEDDEEDVGPTRPFSMAVDRDGVAWLLAGTRGDASGGSGSNGRFRLFHVDTTDASCTATDFVPGTAGYTEGFGMGFASEATGSTDEQLYIAGLVPESGAVRLGVLNRTTFAIERRGALSSQPELTGTGEGNLWGFFPQMSGEMQRIDTETGSTNESYPTELTLTGGAWAVAFWGGDFYIFFTSDHTWSTPSSIYHLDTETREVSLVVVDAGLVVTGAGVSTCAPIELY